MVFTDLYGDFSVLDPVLIDAYVCAEPVSYTHLYLGDTVIAGKFQKLPKEIVLTEIAAVFRIVTDCLLLQLINKKDLMNSANLLNGTLRLRTSIIIVII